MSAPIAVAGVVGEVHRVNRPYLVARALEREDCSRVADVAVGDMGLDRKNIHGTHLALFHGPHKRNRGFNFSRVPAGEGGRPRLRIRLSHGSLGMFASLILEIS